MRGGWEKKTNATEGERKREEEEETEGKKRRAERSPRVIGAAKSLR